MILSVDILMCRWGRWCANGRCSGLGYPGSAAFTRDMSLFDSFGSRVPDIDLDVLQVDQAVHRMPSEYSQLCVEYYVRGGSKVAVAQRLGLRKTKFYEMLDKAQADVCRYLEAD